MKPEPVSWSLTKQQQLQEQLVGMWAEDVWSVQRKRRAQRSELRFALHSPSLKTELKYALWWHFTYGQRDLEKCQPALCSAVTCIVEWLNQSAPACGSLLEKSLEHWDWSLRSYLVAHGRLRPRTTKFLLATQTYKDYPAENYIIKTFRWIYATIRQAYDDRPEMERDVWNLRKLGYAVTLTKTSYLLNFTPIVQPWLRQLAKDFIHYNLALHGTEDCRQKIVSIRRFSQFLVEQAPAVQSWQIDRALIVKYIGYLSASGCSAQERHRALVQLRLFLEISAHQLQKEALPRERLIFDEDLPRRPEPLPREIPEEVLAQLREHLESLPTTLLRMVVILLECGLRIGELCSLSLDCLMRDDKQEWYLRLYQSKKKQEHVIPLVNETVVGAIQAQQQEIKARWGTSCAYLFPSIQSPQLPFKRPYFTHRLNMWAVEHQIVDRTGKLYRFQSHQFRHTVGMRLINDGVPLDTISRLFNQDSLAMTQRFARKRAAKVREELERVHRRRKTVNYQGETVTGDPRANDLDAQMIRKGVRGQTLAVGGCARLVVLGECNYANKGLTCPMWLTSTDDLPALQSFSERAIRLHQRATEVGNQFVIQQQGRIIANLALRINSLQEHSQGTSLSLDELRVQLRADLMEAESGLQEAQEAGLRLSAKQLERTVLDLKARIAALEETT